MVNDDYTKALAHDRHSKGRRYGGAGLVGPAGNNRRGNKALGSTFDWVWNFGCDNSNMRASLDKDSRFLE